MTQVLLASAAWLLLVVSYYVFEAAREKRHERLVAAPAFAPPPDTPEEVEKARRDADVLAGISALRGMDQAQKTQWAEEKLEEGWTQEDVDHFLANRPLLELN